MDKIELEISQKMKNENLSAKIIDFFLRQRLKVKNGQTGLVDWKTIHSLEREDIISLNLLENKNKDYLDKVVFCKLNGGLGTSMGLSEPKSSMEVKDNFSFLEITLKQIETLSKNCNKTIPLILMNSYSTDKKTKETLNRLNSKNVTCIMQNKVPRLKLNNLEPIQTSNQQDEWCPPGHGDFWFCLEDSNLIENLIKQGFEYIFISNIDNLGATYNSKILNYLIENKLDFLLEMTEKLECDKKGGTVYKEKNYKKLLEIAQVPKEHKDDFMNQELFPFFSTNNLWVRLKALREKMAKNFDLSLIINHKKIQSEDIIQLETPIASAISSFEKSKVMIVNRDRFLPVKLCEDLLLKRSDFYKLKDFNLIKNTNLKETTIKLDEEFYKDFFKFNKYFLIIPSLKNAIYFEVSGEFIFDKKIEIIGKVVLKNKTKKPIFISSLKNKTLENENLNF